MVKKRRKRRRKTAKRKKNPCGKGSRPVTISFSVGGKRKSIRSCMTAKALSVRRKVKPSY